VIIDRQVGRSSPKKRVEYLLFGTDGNRDTSKVDILDGDPELFTQIAEKNPYKTKTYNFLISFAESKEELQRKLERQGKTIEELYEEVISFLLPAEYYPREALNILAVGHADTDNYHIHLTVENYDHLNGKTLYIPKTKAEVEFYRALEDYINIKYDLDFRVKARSTGKAGIEKIKRILKDRGTYKDKTRDEVKEEITQHLTEMVLSGEIESREELIEALLEIPGLEIKRIGKSYISFEFQGQRYRLKGGIYDEGRFHRVREELTGVKRDKADVERVFSEALQKRTEQVKTRRKSYDIGALGTRMEFPHRGVGPERDQTILGRNRGELCELKETPLDSNGSPLDRCFALDWASAIKSSLQANQRVFSSLRVSNDNQRTEVLSDKGHNRLLAWRERVGKIRSEEDMYSYEVKLLEKKMKVRELLNEIRKKEIQLLKELDPEEVLSALGIEYRKMNGYLLMHSPIREGDEHPSFTAFYGDVGYWVYKDHATGWSGSSIDLWMAVRNVDYVTAVREMRETFGIDLYDNSPDLELVKKKILELLKSERDRQREKRRKLNSDKEFTEKLAFKVLEITNEITDPELRVYLKKRGIKRIPKWLKQVRYLHLPTQREYTGLAVENDSGALNVRTLRGKGKYVIFTEPTQSQTYSLIRRALNNRKLVVVEGLFDALSLEQVAPQSDYDILILNGVNNLPKTIQNGVYEAYNTVIIALDNDPKGSDTMELLKRALRGRYEVKKLNYEGKDLNEWLVKYSQSSPVTVEVVSSRPYLAGVVVAGEEYVGYGETAEIYELVITDNERVFDRMGRKREVLRITEVSTAEEISALWSSLRFRGAPLILTKDGRAPDWIFKGLREAKRKEKQYAPHLTSKFEIVEVSPPEPKLEKYWLINGRVVFREDIEDSPELYLLSGPEEVKQIAKEILERGRRLEALERKDSLDDDYDPSPEL